MAFPLSFIVNKVLNEETTQNSEVVTAKDASENIVKESKSLKRQFPFESEPDDETSNILPEAADVLDSIFSSLCSVSDSSSVLERNLSPEVLNIFENLNEKAATPPKIDEVVNTETSSVEVIDISENSNDNNDVLVQESVETGYLEDNLDFSHIPTQVTGCWKEFLSNEKNNYLRGCKW